MENNNEKNKSKYNNKDNRDNNSSRKKQSSSYNKRKECPIESGAITVDYKDSRALQKFTSERGKILPRRISSVSSRSQRTLAIAIKRARYLALLPYVAD